MKRKSVWILNHHAGVPENGSGTRHYDFSRELVKRGYSVTVFASSHIHYTNKNLLLPSEKYKICMIEGVRWIWINTLSYQGNGLRRILGMFDYYLKVLRISKKFEGPDIVLGSAVHLLACLAAYKISKRSKIPFISEIRDLWPETLIQMGRLKRNSVLAKAMNALEDYIYKKSDAIIITAPGMKKYITERGFEADKIVYINNGTDIRNFDECSKLLNGSGDERLFLDSNKFNVVYAGGHGQANALQTAVEAAKTIKERGFTNIKFSFYGDGPLKAPLSQYCMENEIDNVVFFGAVPKTVVPSILVQANALLIMGQKLELYKYGVSMNKLFESLCAAVPIVFAFDTINDYVSESNSGITVEPENSEAVADAILQLYQMSPEDRRHMGERGRIFVLNNFDIPILVNQLEGVLNRDYAM